MFLEPLSSRFIIRRIVDRVQIRLGQTKSAQSLEELKKRARDVRPSRDFEQALRSEFGLIAEIKRKSPSLGDMRNRDVASIAAEYEESHCVKAISVLTNEDDFGMDVAKLREVGEATSKPILRKEFIFDEYQVWEARAYGADAILLMANILTRTGLRELSSLAESLGMAVLFESHTEAEISKIPSDASIWGINSRAFMSKMGIGRYVGSKALRLLGLRKDLSIKSDQFALAKHLPVNAVKVAESGVSPEMVGQIRELGFHSVLVGTSILMSPTGVKPVLESFDRSINELGLPVTSKDEPRFIGHHVGAVAKIQR